MRRWAKARNRSGTHGALVRERRTTMRTVTSLLVYDEFVPTAVAATPVYSPATANDILGRADQLTWQVVGDNLNASWTGAVTLTVRLQHSADGRNWLDHSGAVATRPAYNVSEDAV